MLTIACTAVLAVCTFVLAGTAGRWVLIAGICVLREPGSERRLGAVTAPGSTWPQPLMQSAPSRDEQQRRA